jgi:hypothetical protein
MIFDLKIQNISIYPMFRVFNSYFNTSATKSFEFYLKTHQKRSIVDSSTIPKASERMLPYVKDMMSALNNLGMAGGVLGGLLGAYQASRYANFKITVDDREISGTENFYFKYSVCVPLCAALGVTAGYLFAVTLPITLPVSAVYYAKTTFFPKNNEKSKKW